MSKNYKKIYEKEFNIKIDGNKYDIHHLDFNRENNDISNLLLLPKKLHQRYHNIIKYSNKYIIDGKILSDFDGINYIIYEKNILTEYFDVIIECGNWKTQKELFYIFGRKYEL